MLKELTFNFIHFLDKYCNDLLRLYGDEQKVFDEIFCLVEKQGRYSVPTLLKSKSFRWVFGSPESMSSGNKGKERLMDGAPSSSGNAG